MSGRPVLPAEYGTRDDPHAQGRAARQQPVLLHSLSLFREVFEAVYAHREISTVVEVGVESGQVSSLYTDLGADRVYCVDPFPSDELRELLAGQEALELVERPSPAVLGELPVADLYVLDGDHNYATVRGEVDWIVQNAPDAVVVMHDVLWPCSRRDQYYLPSLVPEEDRHPETQDGPTVWDDGVTPAGFVGMGAFSCAVEAGGERNGVLTAVEDALAAAADDSWRLVVVPAVFGVAVLVRATPETEPLLEALTPWTGSRLLWAMENNRLALYTRVLQMQHDAVQYAAEAARHVADAAQHAADVERLTGTIAESRQEVDQLGQRVADLRQRLEHAYEVSEQRRRDVESRDAEVARLTAEADGLRDRVGELGAALEAARLSVRLRRSAGEVTGRSRAAAGRVRRAAASLRRN